MFDSSPTTRTATRLTLRDRKRIAEGLAANKSIAAIARDLPHHSRTGVLYEVHRFPAGQYDPYLAHTAARASKRRGKQSKVAQHEDLRAYVEECLYKFWSPQQISVSLDGNTFGLPSVSATSIYTFVYQEKLTRYLRTKRAKSCKRSQQKEKIRYMRGRYKTWTANDWQLDTMYFMDCPEGLAVLVNCVSKRIYLQRVRYNDSDDVRNFLHRLVMEGVLTSQSRVSFDHREENSCLPYFRRVHGVGLNQVDKPYHKGLVENTVRLLRDFFHVGTDLRTYTDLDIQAVEDILNDRIRQSLGWMTPRRASLLFHLS